jgi:hypothetical protein
LLRIAAAASSAPRRSINNSCVQAAATARVAGGPDILKSAKDGDGASVLCHVIAVADGVNQRDEL